MRIGILGHSLPIVGPTGQNGKQKNSCKGFRIPRAGLRESDFTNGYWISRMNRIENQEKNHQKIMDFAIIIGKMNSQTS